jgi:hypothetical protein
MRTLLFLLAFTACAHAQFNVTVTLPRSSFMALEPMPASVQVANRSGADIVLGGPGRGSWLSFEMKDSTGRSLSPIEVSSEDMVQIPAGGTIQRKVVVTDAYAPTDIGNYALTARVLHSPTQQYYASNRVRFNITDSKPIWEQTFGMPEGYKDVGKVRRYALSVFRDNDSSSLYFRLIDDPTGLRLQTYRLGPVSMVYDPQITVDHENRLQVLFLSMPKVYTYVVIKPDGSLFKRSYYREVNGNRPQLAASANGDARIIGGEYFDPAAPAPKSKAGGRGVSERPPGL